MLPTKLIIVTGISGSGKSSTSKKIAAQLWMNGVASRWLHEEMKNHPIRDGEFPYGDLSSEKDMDINCDLMYEMWEKLVQKIENQNAVYVMEGCLYQNIIRYFFNCHYPKEKIILFYDKVMGILSPLKPVLVHLLRHDMKASFKKAFEVRGERWKNIILSFEGDVYFKTHQYLGEDSIYEKWYDYQNLAVKLFERVNGYKISIDTSEESWDAYLKEITDYLGIHFISKNAVDNPHLDRYCGTYETDIDGRKARVIIKTAKDKLFCQVPFWSNMEMVYLGNNEFELLSFPIQLSFHFTEKKTITVSDNYDWDLSGKTLIEIYTA